MLPVIETFLSIDGEGPTSGQLAAFVRFQGCNLRCRWCDTTYSFSEDNVTAWMTPEEIYSFIKSTGAYCVTLTGGEPLIQQGIDPLLRLLNDDTALLTHIETNGSVDVSPFREKFPRLSFILDYKLLGSGMTDRMCINNLQTATMEDAYKFVVSSRADLEQAAAVIGQYGLCKKTQVFFSPVLGEIRPAEMVDFLKEKTLSRVRLQLQLHKYIWDPAERGV